MKKITFLILGLILAKVSYSYDIINQTYLINETDEEITVYYNQCTTGLNTSTTCDINKKLIIPPKVDGNNIGEIGINAYYNSIHITKIKSEYKESNFASVPELLQLIDHGYKSEDIMMCSLFQQSAFVHMVIDSINEQFTCKSEELFLV